jgi:histidyl-tRNA synthetase
MLNESIRAATRLRGAGLKVQVYFDPDPLREQIGYAVKKDIPALVILGPDEAARGQLTIRNLRSKQQENLPWEEAIGLLKKWLG